MTRTVNVTCDIDRSKNKRLEIEQDQECIILAIYYYYGYFATSWLIVTKRGIEIICFNERIK